MACGLWRLAALGCFLWGPCYGSRVWATWPVKVRGVRVITQQRGLSGLWRRLLAGCRAGRLAVVIGLAAPVGIAHADENWTAAQAAFEVCLARFPDVGAIHETLAQDGWRYEGNEQGLRIHTRNGFRAVAATQGNRQTASRCAVSSSRLTEAAATGFATEIATRLEGAKRIDLSSRGVPVAWEGRLRGKTLRLGVVPNGNFRVMRGAVVVLGVF